MVSMTDALSWLEDVLPRADVPVGVHNVIVAVLGYADLLLDLGKLALQIWRSW